MTKTPLPPLLVLILVGGLLEVGAALHWFPGAAFPAPSRIVAGYADLWADGHVIEPTLATFSLTLIATAIASLVGIPLGIVLARAPLFGQAYEAWLGGLFAAPLILFYPVFLVIFHRTNTLVIVMSAITATLPIVIQTRLGMRSVPAVLRAVGRSFNLNGWQAFRLIEFPAALPNIVTGIRLALIYGLVSTIGLEYLIDYGGLGAAINDLYAAYDIPQMYGEIGIVVVIAATLLWLLDRAERWIRPA